MLQSGDIPGGTLCLAELQRRGIAYEVLDEKRGVQTPIAIRVPLGGVHYETWGEGPLVCDCRLAVALVELGPELRAAGVRAVRFSGAYVYRTTRSGKRLSLHAHGLAIDLHDFTIGNQTYSVKRDYVRGASASNCAQLPPLNQVACRVESRGLLKELLTPDSDRDHHDHFHFGVAPLPTSE